MIFKSKEEEEKCSKLITSINHKFFTPVVERFNVRKAARGRLPVARLALETKEDAYNIYLVFDNGKADIVKAAKVNMGTLDSSTIKNDIMEIMVKFAAKGPRYFYRKFQVNVGFI